MVVDPVPRSGLQLTQGAGGRRAARRPRIDHRVGRPDDTDRSRSDTVTRPSVGMRAAMAEAEVGDDQFGDDRRSTASGARRRTAGQEAALWFPTGTMANQVVLRTLTSPGDDVIVSRGSHAVWHETGGSGANAGVS